jgi:hypothetical protein
MSGWGKLDSKQLTGNVRVTFGSANVANSAGNATIFLSEVKPGDYFVAGAVTGNSNVKYYVLNVISNVALTLDRTYEGSNANVLANVQQGPKWINYTGTSANVGMATIQRVYGVDYVEANVPGNKANGWSQPGWSYQVRYRDAYAQVRVKTEVLVASSKYFNRDITSGNLLTDANDDAFVRDSQ